MNMVDICNYKSCSVWGVLSGAKHAQHVMSRVPDQQPIKTPGCVSPSAFYLPVAMVTHNTRGQSTPRCYLSVRLHAQLSQITAIVRLCYSIGQLHLSEYTCQ